MVSRFLSVISGLLFFVNASYGQNFKEIKFSKQIKDRPLALLTSDDSFVLYANSAKISGMKSQSDFEVTQYQIDKKGKVTQEEVVLRIERVEFQDLGEFNGDHVYIVERITNREHELILVTFSKDGVESHSLATLDRSQYFSPLMDSRLCFIAPDQSKIGIFYTFKNKCHIMYVNKDYKVVSEISFPEKSLVQGNMVINGSMANNGDYMFITHDIMVGEGSARLKINTFLASVITSEGKIIDRGFKLENKNFAAPVASTNNGELVVVLSEDLKGEVKYTSFVFRDNDIKPVDSYSLKDIEVPWYMTTVYEVNSDNETTVITGTNLMSMQRTYRYNCIQNVFLNADGSIDKVIQTEGQTSILKDHGLVFSFFHEGDYYNLHNCRNKTPNKLIGDNNVWITKVGEGKDASRTKMMAKDCFGFMQFSVKIDNEIYFLLEKGNDNDTPKSFGVVVLK